MDVNIAPALLAWYDRHARVLPWRIPPGTGQRADPYRVWLSEVMLQQTTVAAVKGYFHRFTTRWPDVAALAAADDDAVMAEWAGLGYYARARNLLACARVVARTGWPEDEAGLRALPGIGPYTAAAIAAIAFDQPAVVVDGNVERVTARLFAETSPLPAAKPRLRSLAASISPQNRPGDFAQAMMDLGATICTPRSPDCPACPLAPPCRARAQGIAATLPAKAPKAPKKTRRGTVWIGFTDTAVLTETRPKRGLLGGTLAFPGTGWDGSNAPPPAPADWRHIGTVRHIFTHFSLDLDVMAGHLCGNPQRGNLVALTRFDPSALPGLMAKAWALTTKDTTWPQPPVSR